MAKVQRKRKGAKRIIDVPEAELPQRVNYMILGAGVLVVIIGFLVMSAGDAVSPLSVTIAPIILFLGFCVIIPIGIIYKPKKITGDEA
ncbi:MAG: DUF3098 domain-containing protein [Bacteroidota bacterium]|jgi:hypothetical protein|nr:DUF3098 domain-containing protein [Bacteroidota bacterium]